MDKLDYWRLCDALSVVQAALLIAGEDPAARQDHINNCSAQDCPDGYAAAFSALKNVVLSSTLSATVRYDAPPSSHDENYFDAISNPEPDWNKTTVKVEALKSWLVGRGFTTGFFFPVTQKKSTLGYLDPQNPFYAPKLAAAVSAWEVVTSDPTLLNGKKPKQALEKYLRENAVKYGLTNDDGNPNKLGIEEACKVANWNPEGGVNKTPVYTNPPTLKVIDKQKKSAV